MKIYLSLVGVALISFACARAELKEGTAVSLNQAEVTKECKELGIIYGKGGGMMGGAISDEDLMRYATNDLRNKAAEMGATHLVMNGPSVGGGLTHSTTANVSGVAFKCPKK